MLSSRNKHWIHVRHLLQIRQGTVWSSGWLNINVFVYRSQGNTFVIELAFSPAFNQALIWENSTCNSPALQSIRTSLSSILLFFLVTSILAVSRYSAKDPCLFTGFSSWPSPSSPCILSTCCWRRPMKEVSQSDVSRPPSCIPWRLFEC